MIKSRFLAVAAVLLSVPVTLFSQSLKLNADNIDDVLAAMTLREKATLLVGGGNVGYGGENSVIGASNDIIPGAAGTTAAIPRLGITPTVLADGPAGVRVAAQREGDSKSYFATGFPVGTLLASTWNQELVETVGKAMGEEVLEYGCDVLLAPGMNIHRSPLCGRNFEYFSEDPVVTGKTAAAYVRGVQSNGVGTSLKHFAANSQETNRTGVNEIVSPRALREIYLKGFEIAVKEGKPLTVMSSYNKLNGMYTQENKELLTTLLRDEWGYDGIVMTDWIGKRNTSDQIRAGNDLMEPGMGVQIEAIVSAVESGELAESDVDACVRRLLSYIVRTPRFKVYAFSNNPDLKAHGEVARKAASEGMVLLKNDNNALPLSANPRIALFGIRSYDFIGCGTGSGDVNKSYLVDLRQGLANAGLTTTSNLEELYLAYKAYQESKLKNDRRPGTRIWGKPVLSEMPLSRSAIENQADSADIAILTIGRQAGEGHDRKIEDDFNLTDLERNLLTNICDAFHAQGKKVVVILNLGSAIETASWKSLPDAILMAWQPGQEGGNALVDLLSGRVNPSGKLTMTFPVSAMDHPSSLNFPINVNPQRGGEKLRKNVDYTEHKEGINVGYRYFDKAGKEVSYPFGHGLSYTTFQYSKPVVKGTPDGFTASVTVTNTGNVAGKEAVQLYVAAPRSERMEKPAKELKGYAKTRLLAPGESQTLTFHIGNYDIASYDETSHSWVAEKGRYDVMFGASVADIRCERPYDLRKGLLWETNDILHASAVK